MDCPELDDVLTEDDECPLCSFERETAERLDFIEGALVMALATKPLSEHPHRAANSYLRAALSELDELTHQLRSTNDDCR